MSTDPSPSLWRRIQKQNFTKWKALADYLELNPEQRKTLLPNSKFPLNLPLRLAAKIVKGTLDDPLLRQFVPTQSETTPTKGFIADPVGDAPSRRSPKLLHKYNRRALLVCTSACVMNCRFCFRQNFDYADGDKSFREELAILAADPSIKEVILSGGDPLSLSDAVLGELLGKLTEISHIKRIRFHTRFPIGIPERIDDSFINLLAQQKKQIWFVVHSNHPLELDADVLAALKRVQKLGIPVLAQTVLLKGVNDDTNTLQLLSETLVNAGVIPYYLHQLDRVAGAAHFEVHPNEGLRLVEEIAKYLPGYAVPKYVEEIPGKPYKTRVLPKS